MNVPFVRTAVGDKYMLRELAQRNWWLAAEASGHIIQKQICPSGDGLLTAITAIQALLSFRQDSRWSWKFEPWQMQLVNISAKKHKPIKSCPHLLTAIKSLEIQYPTELRMVIRWSGTESKLRLMAEAKDVNITNSAIKTLICAANIDLDEN
jgi:phosphoglucosamine mutase